MSVEHSNELYIYVTTQKRFSSARAAPTLQVQNVQVT